jgi:hypothetical protein
VTVPTHEERENAKETLAFIRQMMESASTFTAVSGWGLVTVGVVGLAAAALAWSADLGTDLRVWIPAAGISVLIATGFNVGKARRLDVPIWSGAIRKLAWVMTPALAVGGLLTFALHEQGAPQLLPGMWLALYGAGVTAGGTFSVRAIRWMGLAFIALGAVALFRPDVGLLLLGLGFGGLHVAIGIDVIVRHGG